MDGKSGPLLQSWLEVELPGTFDNGYDIRRNKFGILDSFMLHCYMNTIS